MLESLELRTFFSGTSASHAAAGDAVGAAILPARQIERLDRGVVAMRTGTSTAYVSWRLFGDDASHVAFNLYRVSGTASPVKLNATPIAASTNYSDTGVSFTSAIQYFVRPVLNGVEGPDSARYTLAANAPTRQYVNVPLQKPADRTIVLPAGITGDPGSHTYGYTANDTSVGDLDGDGKYELIVKWDPSNPDDIDSSTSRAGEGSSKDNAQAGFTGNVLIDAYKLDGTLLWRIDLGRNIRAGAHYTQFQVFDYDGDGKAEMAVKTAPGTVDGLGNNVLMGSDSATADYRNSGGRILNGPEYLTMFNGLTGAAMSTVPYDPPRGITTNNPTSQQLEAAWGDGYGNRPDRFLSATAYLDGIRPSLVMARGYYERAVLAAYDFRGGQLIQRWKFDSYDGTPGSSAVSRQGAHSLAVADVDGDGRDEIVYGAATIDDNGRPLYSTGRGHGDAMHVSDFAPERPGLEVWMVHEDGGQYASGGIDAGMELHDAATGALLVTAPGGINATTGRYNDIGRGVAFDIDPRYPGAEYWGTADGNIYNYAGKDTDGDGVPDTKLVAQQSSNMHRNFGIQWDADPLYETLDGTTISDWRIDTNGNGGRYNYVSYTNQPVALSQINGTKATPNLAADILGDWRDEVIWRTSDNTALQIWTTVIPTTSRQFTAMQDVQYREAIAWQNVGYNQPAHPSFFQGNGMVTPPRPNTFYAGEAPPEAALLDTYQAELATRGGGSAVASNHANFNGSGFVDFPVSGGTLEWSNIASGGGGAATIRFRYALAGTASRTGTLTINGVPQPIAFAPTGGFTSWSTMSIGIDVAPYTPLTVRLASAGLDLANIDELQVRRVADATAPAVSGTPTFNYAGAPDTVSIGFSEDVSASLVAGDLAISSLATPVVSYAPISFSWNAATRVATFVLPPMADGSYRASIAAANVLDASANVMAANASLDFFVLAGDVNHNGAVDFDDLLALAQNYGVSGRIFSDGDLNSDGTVNFDDLLILAQGYGTSALADATAARASLATQALAVQSPTKTSSSAARRRS